MFKELKTSIHKQEDQQDILPGGSRLDTTPAVPVLGQEPGEITENTAKQDVVALQHNHIDNMVLETNEGELRVLKSEEENDLEQYETDEEEFDPGTRSNRPSDMHLVTLGQSNWSPGDTLFSLDLSDYVPGSYGSIFKLCLPIIKGFSFYTMCLERRGL